MISDRLVALAAGAGIVGLTAFVPAQVQWQQTAASGGPGVTAAGYAFDTTRNQMVVFGGEVGAVYSDATSIWDGSAWTQRSLATKPSVRGRANMCYDPIRDRIVLFGGFVGGNAFLADTWTWDGFNWTRQTPARSPSARSGAATFFDPVRGTVVLHGGFAPNNVDVSDLWEWDGTTWSPVASAGGPSGRGAHRIVYDQTNGFAVMHGGFDRGAGSTRDDTWVLNGSVWSTVPSTRPGSLCDQAATWDAARGRVVLFGGLFVNQAQNQFIDLAATWEWEGGGWQQRTPAGGSPSARNHGFMFYDAAARTVRMSAGAASGAPIGGAWELSPVTPASAGTYGTACPTTAGLPVLTAESLPWLGSTFRVRVSNLPATSNQAFLSIGFSDTLFDIFPLPFDLTLVGATGCTLYASIDLPSSWTAVGGTVNAGLPLSLDPVLLRPWFMQALIPDFGMAAPLKLATSEGLRFDPGLK